MVLTVIVFFIGFAMRFVYIPFTATQENIDNILGRVMSIIFLAMNRFNSIAYGIVSGLVAINILLFKQLC